MPLTPSYDDSIMTVLTDQVTIAPSKTFKIDWENKRITSKLIDGIEAVAQSIVVVTLFQIGRWPALPPNFGIDLTLVHNMPLDFVRANIERIIREALAPDERIDSLSDFEIELIDSQKLLVKFKTHVFGYVEENEVLINAYE